jgi:hypothetical protein
LRQSREPKPPIDRAAAELLFRRALADASVLTKLRAKLLAGRLDRQVAAGLPAPIGSTLSVHTARLTSTREREELARSLRACVREARGGRVVWSSRVPVHRAGVVAAEDLIDDVTLLLHSPRPVRARGMARLRLLLSDGAGPLYGPGRGSLIAALRGVLAAL